MRHGPPGMERTGWGRRIRTPTYGSRIRCPTIRRVPKGFLRVSKSPAVRQCAGSFRCPETEEVVGRAGRQGAWEVRDGAGGCGGDGAVAVGGIGRDAGPTATARAALFGRLDPDVRRLCDAVRRPQPLCDRPMGAR